MRNVRQPKVMIRTFSEEEILKMLNHYQSNDYSFQYFDYDLKKQRRYFKKGERYTASPWAMIYTDDNYYLLAYEGGKFKHFRVDKRQSQRC